MILEIGRNMSMSMKKTVITGGGSGLGRALALEYANNRELIMLVGRTPASLEKVKGEIEASGGQVAVFTCDISDFKEVERLTTELLKYRTIDRLINNAGVGIFDRLEHLTKKDIDTMIDINVKGTIYLTQALLPHFKENGSGKIMNIVSTAGLRGKVKETVYCASKFAVRGFSESLVQELEESGITVSAAYMGGMNTPFWNETDYVKDPSILKGPEVVAKEIIEADDGRTKIFIDR